MEVSCTDGNKINFCKLLPSQVVWRVERIRFLYVFQYTAEKRI